MSSRSKEFEAYNNLTPFEKRNHLLSVASELFAKKGYDSVSTSELAATAGCSEYSLFQVFASKDQLYNELFEEWAMMIKHDYQLKLPKNSVLDALSNLYYTLPKQMEQGINYASPYMRPYLQDAVFSRRTHKYRKQTSEVLNSSPDFLAEVLLPAFVAAQENGEVREGDPNTLVHFFWLILVGRYQLNLMFPNQYPNGKFAPLREILSAKKESAANP